MKTKFLYFLLFAAMFIASCCLKKDKYFYLEDNEKLKYKVGDKLVYKNYYNDTAIFIVTDIRQNFWYNSYGGRCGKDKGEYREHLDYTLSKISYVSAVSFNTMWINTYFKKIDTLETFTAGGKTYNKVYCFQNDTVQTETKVVKLYTTPVYGVIWYQQKNGNIWELEQN